MHWKSENRNGKSKRNTRRKKLQQEQNRIRKKYSERFSTFVNSLEHANKHTSPVCICQPATAATATQNNNFKFILQFSEPIFLKKKHVLQQLPAQPRAQSLHFDWMIKFCSDYTRLSNVYENTNLQRNLVGWISKYFATNLTLSA